MARNRIDQAALNRIAAAVAEAEKTSSGEIVCVVKKRSGRYFAEAALLWSAAILFAMPASASFMASRWIEIEALTLTLAGLGIWIAGMAIIALFPPVQKLFVSAGKRRLAASEAARAQFIAQSMHRTRGRTGVLIFVSLLERHAEIIGDQAIVDALGENPWEPVVARLLEKARQGRLADGLTDAVREAGRILASASLPATSEDNELPDHVVMID